MGDKLIRQSIGKGVYFSSVRDPKFKHNRLTVNLIVPLDKETAADNAVVPFILRTGCRECPDLTSLNQRLADLYGASLDADVAKVGGYQIMEVSIRGLDNRFALEGEDITGACAGLLASVVLDPKLDGEDGFDQQDTALQKQYVLDSIDAEVNDKRVYALNRCLQVMCAGEPVAVRRYGDREKAEAITPKSAADAYRRLMDTAAVEILFVGSGSPDSALAVFRQRFSALERRPVDLAPVSVRTGADTAKETVEEMEVSQSKMVMGLRTGPRAGVEDTYARRVFAALYGGTPFSKLFLNVREKLSLCYYCAARYDTFTGLLMVDSGVEAQNKQKAQDEILAQLEEVRKGAFSDEEMANTKLLVKNSITVANDSLSHLESWYLSQILQSQEFSTEEDCRNIDKVTREQVIAAAGAVTLDTVYFLTAKEGA